jgi:hypothetical protein
VQCVLQSVHCVNVPDTDGESNCMEHDGKKRKICAMGMLLTCVANDR